jgi:hypothetical protein
MARPAEKCGPTIICPPNPFGTIHLLTCLARVFQRSHYCNDPRCAIQNITLKCISRPVRTKRKRIPQGCKLPVLLGTKEVSDIRERTFVSPGLLIGGIVQPNGSLRFDWSLGDIEEIQGHVAASANHTDDLKLEKRLDRIYSKLQRFLDSYDDSGPSK